MTSGADGATSCPPKKLKNPPPDDASSLKKYFEPDLVCTTDPPTALPTIGEVVTGAPSSKLLEPLMNPEMVLSLFKDHLLIFGTPRGAVGAAFFAGGAATAVFGAVESSFGSPSPNNENVGLGRARLGVVGTSSLGRICLGLEACCCFCRSISSCLWYRSNSTCFLFSALSLLSSSRASRASSEACFLASLCAAAFHRVPKDHRKSAKFGVGMKNQHQTNLPSAAMRRFSSASLSDLA